MAHASRIAPLDRQHVLKADPLVASFSATYVSCVPCNSKIKLTTSYGLTKWRIHCQRVHGRSKEDTAALEAQALANATTNVDHNSDASMDEPSEGEDELDVIERTPVPPKSPQVPRYLNEEQCQRVLELDPDVMDLKPTAACCRTCKRPVYFVGRAYDLSAWTAHVIKAHGRSPDDIAMLKLRVFAGAKDDNNSPLPKRRPAAQSASTARSSSRAHRETVPQSQPHQPSHSLRRMEQDVRQRFLQLDPLVGDIEASRVYCKSCEQWIKLQNKGAYVLSHWLNHCSGVHKRPTDEHDRLAQRARNRSNVGDGPQNASMESSSAHKDDDENFPHLRSSDRPVTTGAAVVATSVDELDGETGEIEAEDHEDSDSPSDDEQQHQPIARSSQSHVQRSKFTVDERIRFFQLDTLAGAMTPNTVYCTTCKKDVNLGKSTKYDLYKWNIHCKKMHKRTEADIMRLRQRVVSSTQDANGDSDDEGATDEEDEERVEVATNKQDDPKDTSEVDELESDSAPKVAPSPRQRRKRKGRPSTGDRLTTPQRIRMFTLDSLAGAVTPTSVSCTECCKTIQLNKRLKYDTHTWIVHCKNVHKRSDEEAELLRRRAVDGELHENGQDEFVGEEQHQDNNRTAASSRSMRQSQGHQDQQGSDELSHDNTDEERTDDHTTNQTEPAAPARQTVTAVKLTKASHQRRQVLELDDLLGKVEANRVWCIPCGEWRMLDKRSDYSFHTWIQHAKSYHGRSSADFKALRKRAAAAEVEDVGEQQVPAPSGEPAEDIQESDGLPSDADITSHSENSLPLSRVAFLRCDPLVGRWTDQSVFCVDCRKWIQSRGGLANWYRHCAAAGKHNRSRKDTVEIERQALASDRSPAISPSMSTLQTHDDESPPTPGSTAALSGVHNAFLEVDPLVLHYTSNEVHCKDCGPIRIYGLHTFQALRLWHDHCRTAAHRRTDEEVECLRRKAWPDSTSRDDQTFTRMDVDVDPTPAQKRGESMGAAFAIDDIDVSAPMPLTRRSHLRTTAGTHDRAYFVRGPGDKKVLSADKEPHEVNSISRDDGAPEPSGNDVDELFVVDEHTSGGSNNEDDNDDGVIDSVSADQLDRDPRVRDYDDRGMIQCLGQGHWVPRNEWEVHAQDCEPLFAELTKLRRQQRKEHRKTLAPPPSAPDPLTEWDKAEIETDPRVREFSVYDICCDSCGHSVRRAPRFKWEDHRVDCRAIQRRIRLGQIDVEEDDLVNSSFLRLRPEEDEPTGELHADARSDSTEPLAPLPRRRKSQIQRSSISLQRKGRSGLASANQTPDHENENRTGERVEESDDEEPLQIARPPVPAGFELVPGRALPSRVKHVAGLLEFELDPLAKELKGGRVECIECNHSTVRDKWRRHCSVVHHRTTDEQNRIIMSARAAALRESTATLPGNVAGTSRPIAPTHLHYEGRRGKNQQLKKVRVTVPTTRAVHPRRPLNLRVAGADFDSDEDMMEVDKPATSLSLDDGPIVTIPGTTRSLSVFDAHDPTIQQRLISHDPLANALDMKTQAIECKECRRTYSVKWRSGTCSLQFWNRHCMDTHNRTAAETQRVMQLVANAVNSLVTESPTVTRGTKRPIQSGSNMPVPKRLRFSTPNDERVNSMRVRTDDQTQCNHCGRWLDSANFESHVKTRCQKRPEMSHRLAMQAVAGSTSSPLDPPFAPSTLAAAPVIDPVAALQSHNLADYAGVAADDGAKRQAAFLFFLWTHNALAKIAYMKRQRELEEAAASQRYLPARLD